MKIYVDRFTSNGPKLKVTDILYSNKGEPLFKAYKHNSGVITLSLHTHEKYLEIDTRGKLFRKDLIGECITLMPYLYEKDDNDNIICLNDLTTTEGMDKYYNHKNWFMLELLFEIEPTAEVRKRMEDKTYLSDSYLTTVTPLKHEYMITYIPHSISICANPKDFKEVGFEE